MACCLNARLAVLLAHKFDVPFRSLWRATFLRLWGLIVSLPVFLTAQWRNLAMVNYEIDPDILAPYVPAGTEIDFFQGRTFVSLVGFMFEDTRVKGWTIPGHRNFEELNLRFYIRREMDQEIRRGVAFIKEIVPRFAVTAVARWIYGENYVTHAMRHGCAIDAQQATATYEWKHRGRWNRLSVRGEGPPQLADPTSEEAFITEHYWGYTRRSATKTLEYEVAHPSWRLWQNCVAEVDCDADLLYGEVFAEVLKQPPTSCLLADGSPVKVHQGTRLAIAKPSSSPTRK